jgi:hypothetical protein
MAITDHRLDTGVSLGTESLTAVTDIDAEDAEILGHSVNYTIGDFEVPREWLVNRMEEMGFPDFMIFTEPTTKRAYNRVRDRLVDVDNGYDKVDVSIAGHSRRARVFTKKVDNDTFQVDVDVFFDSADADAEHGDWRTRTLGYVNYERSTGSPITRANIDDDSALFPLWEKYVGEVHQQFSHYQETHVGKEFQKLMARLVKFWTEGVKIRSAGAVYFIPARHAETMETLGQLFHEIDEKFKESGSRLEVNTIPVISDEQRRQMVADRAEEELESRVESALETVEEEVEEADADVSEEELVSDLVDVFETQLEDIDDFTAEYNALLEAELNIRDVIQSRRSDVVPEVDDILNRASF